MPECQVCQKSFQPSNNRAKAQHPKYCSGSCKAKAWRQRNPKAYREQGQRYNQKRSPRNEPKSCAVCSKIIPNNRRGPGVQTCSEDCTQNQRKQKRLKLYHTKRRSIQDAKCLVGCAKCGYNAYGGALDFHHLDPSEKDVKNLNYQTVKFQKEIAKCVLVCKNCHAELHDLMRRDSFRYHEETCKLQRATIILRHLPRLA